MFFSKKPDLQATIEMDDGLAYVEFKGDTASDSLIKLAIHYLARYFYICDERQFGPMAKIIDLYSKEKTLNYDSCMRLTASVEGMVYETFNEKEREALASYMRVAHSLPYLRSDKQLQKVKFRYIFKLYFGPDKMNSNLKMSLMLNKQLLPRTAVFILDAVVESLDSKDKKKLQKALQILIKELGTVEERNNLLLVQHPQIEAIKSMQYQ